ncbi:flagellar hook-length control protein FliK [Janthinobacterium psychrotolerans]|uniref:Flagellar hook-length control protein FliK n=1 Tax=Janthinobacterium psychrotolerans TaxID=1747903 RepID=A0A1A7C3N5_9BURK|nr:flagellar hook-length control protein FliK [Janthinobacterium psychrotolerans]OBV40571.1 flagellar hook-length control protein FliK [Janthinobacterium psychrotolerans]
MQTPISQISSPNATPAPARRDMPSGSAPEGDFQRTLNRQLEQRQASGRAQAQTPAQAAAKPASPAPAPAPAPAASKANEQAAAEQAHAGSAKEAAPADKDSDSSESEETTAAEAKPPADPVADMLALVGSIKLAMQQPANGGAAAGDAGARGLAKLDGKSISAAQLLAGQKAAGTGTGTGTDTRTETVLDDGKGGGFAASLGKAQAGATVQAGKPDAGKLALDAQLAATAKAGSALAEPLPKEAAPDLTRLAATLAPGALQQAAAAAVPADKLMGRVGTPAWDQQLGQKVVWMAAGGDQSATLTLNPPDLGPLQVVLTVTNDQADAAFMSAQPEVRQALEAALPRLRDMMAEAGIAFGSATVSDGAPQQNNSQREGSGSGRGGNQGGAVSGGEIAITQGAGRGRPSLGEVDTFA